MSTRKLQESLSRNISSLIDDIEALLNLDREHEDIDFSKQILKLKKQKDILIDTQAYLEKCEKDLTNKLEAWLSFGCKGKIEIILTGEKNDGRRDAKEDSSAHN